jgi:hypothetical protein
VPTGHEVQFVLCDLLLKARPLRAAVERRPAVVASAAGRGFAGEPARGAPLSRPGMPGKSKGVGRGPTTQWDGGNCQVPLGEGAPSTSDPGQAGTASQPFLKRRGIIKRASLNNNYCTEWEVLLKRSRGA